VMAGRLRQRTNMHAELPSILLDGLHRRCWRCRPKGVAATRPCLFKGRSPRNSVSRTKQLAPVPRTTFTGVAVVAAASPRGAGRRGPHQRRGWPRAGRDDPGG
jgi:hypothetical protein